MSRSSTFRLLSFLSLQKSILVLTVLLPACVLSTQHLGDENCLSHHCMSAIYVTVCHSAQLSAAIPTVCGTNSKFIIFFHIEEDMRTDNRH